MQTYLLIALGGALGSVGRYWSGAMASRLLGDGFPWGTLAVNILGSFAIGFFATISGPGGRISAGVDGRLFVMAGLCGGFTTFSAFSLQTLDLMEKGHLTAAGANILSSVTVCILAAWLGQFAAMALNARQS